MELNTVPLNELLQDIYTKNQAVDFLDKISKLGDSLYNVKSDVHKKLDQIFSIEEKDFLVAFCKENKVSFKDPVKFKEFVQKIKETIAEIPVVSLQISVIPTEELVKKISNWFILKLEQKVFLDLTTVPELLAGAIVVSNGVYKDYSVKKMLDEKFKQQPNSDSK